MAQPIDYSLILYYYLRESEKGGKGMRTFNYSAIKEQKCDSDVLGLIAAIYKEAGKQELYLKQRPEELEKLVEIAKIQSTEASNAIEGIVTTSTRIRQLVEEKTTPRSSYIRSSSFISVPAPSLQKFSSPHFQSLRASSR